MAKTAFLNARIDPDLKTSAEKVLDGVGVTASQAITMFYRQVVLRRGLPFDVCIPNAETLAAFKEVEDGGGEIHHGSAEDIFNEILKEKE
jgi:DNA-damage-inducible protein J